MRAVRRHVASGGHAEDYLRDLTVPLHRVVTDLRLTGKPVIAAINGPAAGARLSLTEACHIRLASVTVSFKQAYTSIGLVPDLGWSAILPQLVGPARASWLLAIDPLVLSQDALRLGLVHEVVEAGRLLERTKEVAAILRARSPTAFARAKALLNQSVFPLS